MVSRHKGAEVVVSDPNPARLAKAGDLGFVTAAPADLEGAVAELAGQAGADVVFEVSGAAGALAAATGLLRTRGRLVIVGIHSEPHAVDLFRVFWRELHLLGARVYEPVDFEKAIELMAEGSLSPQRLITSVVPLDDFAAALDALQSGGDQVKILVSLEGKA
jgi:threonine dehydrogenase-like Zn-dependent dehydrogenase